MRAAAARIIAATIAAVTLTPAGANGAAVTVHNGQLQVTATAPGRNIIDVSPEGLAYRIYDHFAPVDAPDCVSITASEAICGGSIMSIRIDGGDGEDLLGLWDVTVPVTAHGGAGEDLIETGTAADDVHAGPGQDAIATRGGDDTVHAGDDRDRVEGGPGNDTLDGEAGADVLRGDGGDDKMTGGANSDLVDGGAGDDDLAGGAGENTMVATRGTDTVTTESAKDTVVGPHRAAQRPRCRATRRSGVRRCSSDKVPAKLVTRTAPKVWPPERETRTRAVASSVSVDVIARSPGNAQHLSVTVAAKKIRRVRVCIRMWDRGGGFLGRFPKRVDTRKDSVKSPHRSAYVNTGQLKKRGCKP